jgi:putative peptidoglycan lipid II flippase
MSGEMNRLVAAGALVAFFVAMLVIVLTSADGGGKSTTPTVGSRTTTRTTATRPATRPTALPHPRIKLTAVGAYDPEGDGHENDDLAPLALDGDSTTFWKTEHYHSFGKTGVGLVLDARRTRPIARVVVSTDTAGSSAEIEIGRNPNGPFHLVTRAQPLTGTTTFKLAKRPIGRYVVVWITALPSAAGEAHVTEVRAFARPG